MSNNYPHIPLNIENSGSMYAMKQEYFQKSIEEYQKREQYELDFYGKHSNYLPSQFRNVIKKEQFEELYKIAQKQLNELIGLPFWLAKQSPEDHELIRQIRISETGKPLCCFCHAIGLPEKNLKEFPIFPYEYKIVKAYRDHNRIFIRKSRGLGVTTLNNYLLAWYCINFGFKYYGYRIIYVAGLGYSVAEDLIFRLRNIFMKNYPELIMSYYHTNDKQIINGVLFEAFSGNNIQSLRSYHNVLFVYVDEADFFQPKQERELLGVISSYEEKSRAKIIMVSTPYLPDGIFYNIEFETSDDYKGWYKLLFDFNDGLNLIYDSGFIDREKNKVTFRREYMGKYEGNVGNMFPVSWVEAAENISEMFPNYRTTPIMPHLVHFIGIDPAWGASKMASKFSITVTRYNPQARYPPIKAPPDYYEKINVTENSDYNIAFNLDLAEIIYSQQFKQPNIKDAVKTCVDLYERYGKKNVYFMVDGSAIPFIESLKIAIHESPDYLNTDPKYWNPSEGFRVVPVLPNPENNIKMRTNLYNLLSARLISLPKEFRSIRIGIGSATGKEFTLDKEESPENDALDSTCYSLLKIYTKSHDKRIYYSQ